MAHRLPLSEKLSAPRAELAQREALTLLNEVQAQTGAWEGWQTYLSGGIAFAAAGASASTSFYFSNKLFNGKRMQDLVSESTRNHLQMGTTIAAIPPAFFLSFNASFAVWNRLLRSLPHMTRQEFKRNGLPLIITFLSSVASFKVGWDAWKDAPLAMRAIIASLRGLSALSTNGLFAVQMKKNMEGFRASSEMHLLRTVRAKLKSLAKNNPSEFIGVLSHSRLFERLIHTNATETQHAKADVNTLFHSLFAVLDGDDLSKPLESQLTTGLGRKIAYSLGALSALPYFASGQSIPEGLLNLSSPAAFWALGSIFGVSSVLVNSALAAIATADAMERLATKEFSPLELISLPLKLYFLLGNSLAYAGMALEYPFPVKNEILAWTEALLNFCVYLSIGDMSFDNFFNKIGSYYLSSRKLLEKAHTTIQAGGTLLAYFEDLNTSDQAIFVKLMDDYLKWALDEALIPFFNYASQETVTELFDPRIKTKLNAFETRRAGQLMETKAASPALSITITQPTRPMEIKKINSIGSIQREPTDSPLEPPPDFSIRIHSPMITMGLHRVRRSSLEDEENPLTQPLLSRSTP